MIIGRWAIENSQEGIPLVFGDGKYPHDPPRAASLLEVALAARLEEIREALEAIEGDLANWSPDNKGGIAHALRVVRGALPSRETGQTT